MFVHVHATARARRCTRGPCGRALQRTFIVVLQPAPAENKNAVVVTSATALRYRLAKISDLGRAIGEVDSRI